jgi:hypothetical protein
MAQTSVEVSCSRAKDVLSDDDASSDESTGNQNDKSSERLSPTLGKQFPPPNPLPPKALMYLKEPLHFGAAFVLMYESPRRP